MILQVTNYTFDASSKTVTFNDYVVIALEHIIYILDATTEEYLYQRGNEKFEGAVAGNVFTFNHVEVVEAFAPEMDDTDDLYIVYNDTSAVPATTILPVFETNGVVNPTQNVLNLVAGTDIAITDDGAGNITFDVTGGGGIGDMLAATYDPATIAEQLVGLTATQALTNKDFTSGTNSFPTFNQNTTGSAAKWITARLLAGNNVDGSADIPFSNKFIVQGTTDTGLTGAQFLGALGTGLVKNTTTTGVLSIAVGNTDYQLPISLTTVGTSGAATFIGNTLNIPNYVAPTPSLTQYRIAVGDASNLLSDNAAITGGRALISDANGVPTHSVTTTAELAYLSGVSASVQTQLAAKADRLLSNLSSPVAINQALTLNTSDAFALGSSTKMWSDLFLADGGLINWNNGNTVLTHSSGLLTLSTGDLRVTTAGTNAASVVTNAGTQTLTNKTLGNFTFSGVGTTGVASISNNNYDLLIGNSLATAQFRFLPFGADTYMDNTGNGSWIFRSGVFPAASTVMTITNAGNVAVVGDLTVADEAYGVGWNGSLEVPTKNAVYDKIQALSVTLTDGSGTTANGTAIDLGGTLTSDVDIKANGGTIDALFIEESTGNVGVGTATPTRALDVIGSVNIDMGALGTFSGINTTNNNGFNIASSIWSIGDDNGAGDADVVGNITNKTINFLTSGTQFVQDGTSGTFNFIGGNVGIGTSPIEALDIVGSIKMVDGNEASGYVLTSDAAGVGSWQPASTGGGTIGQATLDFGASPDNNTSIFIADAAITAISRIIVSIAAEDTPDNTITDILIAGITVMGGNVAAASGFTIYAYTPVGIAGEVLVNYTIQY